MDRATRETRRATAWTLTTAAVLAGLWAVVAACSPDASATPATTDARMALQEVTDSTAVLRGSWGHVSPPADFWRWSLQVTGQSGEVSDTTLAVEVPRRDTSYQETLCVRGVAVTEAGEAEGGEDCASAQVPARGAEAPGTPDVNVEVDTVQTASVDSLRLYDYASAQTGASFTANVDSTAASLTVLTYREGTAWICAQLDAYGQGWYELSTLSPEPTIAAPGRMVADDRVECGVTWQVEDTSALELGDPQPVLIPVEGTDDGGHALLAARR